MNESTDLNCRGDVPVRVYGQDDKPIAELQRYDMYWDGKRWRVHWGDEEET